MELYKKQRILSRKTWNSNGRMENRIERAARRKHGNRKAPETTRKGKVDQRKISQASGRQYCLFGHMVHSALGTL